CQQHNTSPFTF
nr:immunoglobulin light chain junction region [Macaca mulatta]MOV61199.1 immunoglobulin light chain junction region [Macaca mulatta]MOV61218.1 immunoglobulin light chain junction region [Macaca mulatta]MOV61994.1 immunoglobulin light chain junction region [Macaca mulatta]MOV62945.1 immunoglobulin light chain junction region [Macaca mulatta]